MHTKSGDSSLWKNLVKGFPNLNEFEFCCIGNGLTNAAWSTCWIAPGLQITNMDLAIPDPWKDVCVADLVNEYGFWRCEDLQWLPSNLPPLATNSVDGSFGRVRTKVILQSHPLTSCCVVLWIVHCTPVAYYLETSGFGTYQVFHLAYMA